MSEPLPEILVDIEVLGLRPGSAIIEIGAVLFSRKSGEALDEFHRIIQPDESETADLATLKWHQETGTWPRATEFGVSLLSSLTDFSTWSKLNLVETFWAWGASFDFPHLDAAYSSLRLPAPWRFSRCQCARTIWNVAFPEIKATKKPHCALDDARISAKDLWAALQKISGK